MDHVVHKHSKIRFRRKDITGLHTFPSAAGQDHLIQQVSRRKRLIRWASIITAAGTALLVAVVAAVYFVGAYGISTENVHDRAEAALREMAGLDVAVSLGPARLSFGGAGLLAIKTDTVRLTDRKTGRSVVEAGALEFGVEILPLLNGSIEFGSAFVSDARLSVAGLPARPDSDWSRVLKNEAGLYDPQRVVAATFGAVHDAFAALTAGEARTIVLRNITIDMPEGSAAKSVILESASLAVSDDEHILLNATATIDGRAMTLGGTAERDAVSGRVSALDLAMTLSDQEGPTGESADNSDTRDRLGAVALSVSGAEGIGGAPSTLAASVKVGRSRIWIDQHDHIEGEIDLSIGLASDKQMLEIERAVYLNGRTNLNFRGAVAPREASDLPEPHYRLELISDRSFSGPSDSPEPPMEFVTRIAGTFSPEPGRLVLDEIALRTAGGELSGTAALNFAPGMKPGIDLAIKVPMMPVAQVKQIWPPFAAAGARRWALNHLFGGTIANSTLEYHVAPGRLGNGVPLSHEEVFGRFDIADARFDVTGDIPPIREAIGSIAFQGNDVDVALASGKTYFASGRSVSAANGTMSIKNANLAPVVGDLDIEIEGSADAIAELASVEPINGLSRIGFAPHEFSGKARGTVKAKIPLVGGSGIEDLPWLVSLSYTDLAISKPIDGQLFSEASGTLVVDPQKAVVAAKAKLNGAPADVNLVEPFGEGTLARKQDVDIVLDDKARDKIVPGLGDLISGPVTVSLDMSAKDRQTISVDLAKARLNLPWAGWSKGPGIEGKVDFVLEMDGSTSKLSGLKLRGKSFAIDGDVTLENGDLRSARFSNVSLNRDDAASLTIDRSGKTLKVDIKGKSLDVRSVISQLTKDADAAASATGSSQIRLTASVDSLIGFHGEKLRGVELAYRGSGSRIDNLDVSATTQGGATVKLVDKTESEQRRMEMESSDAGSVLRFLDIYEHMEGGKIRFVLAGKAGGTMKGSVDAMNFTVVDEPKLASIVSAKPVGDAKSLSQAVDKQIDTTRVKFERGYAQVEKGPGKLALEGGVLRGPSIGTTFQGIVYDANNNIAVTGTFMPAYGVNRIFGELPLVGAILGNGRDRGLIGVTYKLTGKVSKPELQINPLSLIAPGIFRSIFEFR